MQMNCSNLFKNSSVQCFLTEDKGEEQDPDLDSASESETEDHEEADRESTTTELLKNQRTRINHHF